MKLHLHCKPKPCIAHRELPVSQFPQGKTCFHYREPLFSLQGPCFHYRDFFVNPCTSLLGIAVYQKKTDPALEGRFICAFSFLISLSFTIAKDQFKNHFIISSNYFDMVFYLKHDRFFSLPSILRYRKMTTELRVFELLF